MEEGRLADDRGMEDFGGLLVAPLWDVTGWTVTGGTVTGTGTSGTTTTGGGGCTGAVSTGGGPTGAGLGMTSTGSAPPTGPGAGSATGTSAGADASATTLSCVGAGGATSAGTAGTEGTVRIGGLVKSGRTTCAGALTGTNVTVFLAMTSRIWRPPKKDSESRAAMATGARLCTRSLLPGGRADEYTSISIAFRTAASILPPSCATASEPGLEREVAPAPLVEPCAGRVSADSTTLLTCLRTSYRHRAAIFLSRPNGLTRGVSPGNTER